LNGSDEGNRSQLQAVPMRQLIREVELVFPSDGLRS
jgi:hypothetical protein